MMSAFRLSDLRNPDYNCDRCLLLYVVVIFTASINSLFALNERYYNDDINSVVCYLNAFFRVS